MHVEDEHPVLEACSDGDGASGLSELDCVFDQVYENLLNTSAVAIQLVR